MTNLEIAAVFEEVVLLLTLKQENSFKIKAYQNAAEAIEAEPQSISEILSNPNNSLPQITGIGSSSWQYIKEILATGTLALLEDLRTEIPPGVVELSRLNGLGPKKIQLLWKDLGVSSVQELAQMITNGTLVKVKGFGAKTVESLKQEIERYQKSRNQMRLDLAEAHYTQIVKLLQTLFPNADYVPTGDYRRNFPTIDKIAILARIGEATELIDALQKNGGTLTPLGLTAEAITLVAFSVQIPGLPPFELYICSPQNYGTILFYTSTRGKYRAAFAPYLGNDYANEELLYAQASLPFLPPELREELYPIERWNEVSLVPDLLTDKEIKGILHAHSTYSDGKHTLAEMAEACKNLGYEYLGITDHSRTAVYANGLSIERVLAQREEINELNRRLAPFYIFQGIESDILADGSLDYPDEVLGAFDFIIASIHSGFKMDRATATQRLINAIQNPHTTILGHPTGRLLLNRDGYPIDHSAVLQACAKYKVAVEINANPWRLDLDWEWIAYATELGIKIAICPDAHSIAGIQDVRFGVKVARKGALTAMQTLNTLSKEGIQQYFTAKKLVAKY